MNINIDDIQWLLENATAYSISKNCGLSTQAVDKYKNGLSDIMNMRLKHAIQMTSYAQELQNQWPPLPLVLCIDFFLNSWYPKLMKKGSPFARIIGFIKKSVLSTGFFLSSFHGIMVVNKLYRKAFIFSATRSSERFFSCPNLSKNIRIRPNTYFYRKVFASFFPIFCPLFFSALA